MKQQLYLKAEDTVLHLSKLYALNRAMSGKKSMSREEKDEQVIDNNSRNLIDHYTQKAIPVIRTLLEKSKGTMDLSALACNETETFMDMVKELSEILAMCEIARERNLQRGSKTELMAPGREEEDRLIIEDRAGKIRQQVGFQTTVAKCPADPDACLKVLKNYVDDLSANKIDPKQLINGTQPQYQQPLMGK